MKTSNSVAILGGSGFVGSELCAQLSASGYAVHLVTRHPERCRHLKVLPSLTIHPVANYRTNSIRNHVSDCHTLINLVGILNEKGNNGKQFHDIHVGVTRDALNTCETANIPRMLQMSALNADSNGPSFYLKTKGKAENYIKTFSDENINYTIFRPSVIFGENDDFLNRFATLLKFMPGFFPLACPKARFSPVYVGDVVKRMVQAIDDKSTFNQSYNLCGPYTYTLKELVQYTANVCGYKRVIIGLPAFLSRLQASIFEYFPGKPFSKDNYKSLKIDSVCEENEPCPTSLQAIAPLYLSKDNSRLTFSYDPEQP